MPIAKQAGSVKQSSGSEVKHTPAAVAPVGGVLDNALLQEAIGGIGEITPQHALAAQRQVGNGATREIVQRRSGVGLEGGDLDARLAHQIQSARGGGSSLDSAFGSQMSSAFGADFSNVRVHHDAKSDRLNRSLNAKAFTLGSDIFFSRGTYQPGSTNGKELIAHELTHVVQQGGVSGNKLQTKLSVGAADDLYEREADRVAHRAVRVPQATRPVVRSGKSGVQRLWNPFKKKTPKTTAPITPSTGKKPQSPQISSPKAPSLSNDPSGQQQDAEVRMQSALERARAVVEQGKQKATQIQKQNEPTKEEQSIRKSSIGVAKNASKRSQKAEAGAVRSTKRAGVQFDYMLKTVEGMRTDVMANGVLVAGYLLTSELEKAQQYSAISATLADSATKRVDDAEKQLAEMEETAKVDAAAARAGIDKAYDKDKEKPRDWAGVEKSASDAAMAMEQNLYKMMRYHAYLQMDAATIKQFVIEKTTAVAQEFGEFAATHIIAAGRARANLKAKSGPLSDERALKLLGDAGHDTTQEEAAKSGTESGKAMAALEKPQDAQPPEVKGNKYLDPSLKEGKWAGFKNKLGGGLKKAGSTIAGGAKSLGKLAISPFMAVGRLLDRKIFRRDRGKRIAKARAVQGLELMAKFQVESEQRLADAEKYVGETSLLHEKSLQTYDKIDLDKKESENGAGNAKLNGAIVMAGQSWEDVAKTGAYRDTLKKYRDDVSNESSAYSKYGKRAMSGGKKFGMTLLGLLTGTGLKTLTGGLFRLEKVEVGAGYSAKLQAKTIWDDLKQAYRDFKEATHLRGMGGKWGARIYAVLQGISFFLGIARTLCSTISLYLTIAGVPQVAGGFAAAALYSAIAKAAIDLALLIWTAIASYVTVDPRSRSKLKGRIAKHGLDFGEGAATAATAGMLAGITADPGAFIGHVTPKVFDTSQSTGGGVMNWSQHLPIVDKEFYFMKMGANTAIGQAIPLSNTIGSQIAQGVNDSNVRLNKMQMDTGTSKHAQEIKEKKQQAGIKNKEAKGKFASFKAKLVEAAEAAAKKLLGRSTTKEKNERYELVMGILNKLPGDVSQVDNHTQILPEGSLE